MIDIKITGTEGIGRVRRWLQFWKDFSIDFAPIASEVAQVAMKGRERMTLAGTGVDGKELTEIQESTRKRRARAGKGDGPPLAPDRLDSGVNRDYLVDAYGTKNRIVVNGTWMGNYWLVYHQTGASRGNWHLPKRDVIGIEILTREEVRSIVHNYIAESRSGRNSPRGGTFGRLFGGTHSPLSNPRVPILP